MSIALAMALISALNGLVVSSQSIDGIFLMSESVAEKYIQASKLAILKREGPARLSLFC